MKSFVNFNKGRTPRQAHVDLDGLKDDELGRQGFSGRAAQLYRRNDPTSYRVEGNYRLRNLNGNRLEPADLTDARGMPMPLFENADCRILLSRRSQAMPAYHRNARGDESYLFLLPFDIHTVSPFASSAVIGILRTPFSVRNRFLPA